ncbi:hypothetical protein EN781_00085 [Mesorhizobium sp. M4A.F.Ca.ET.090.04.2.1]|uniref:hypothetical protein n=1 Tax=Mesorhizobium sp. M4A.F.Ca.ET.090.04.2.1 TaxID=2496663 RepID=UPI000FCB4D12|nr:hypothetical protein [Mesorhizobium sp. M4A.F.Ca.ET.090.04.2.1]RVC47570.1 hypothetical protein EN781_00085 [Mesorhizobium sp. M4A.F.Ca.ET.090.04.2.1]
MSMLLNPYAFATGGGGGGTLPPGATSFLDFVNGFYYAGGSWQSVSAMLGGGFDPSAISGSGMYIDFSNANRPTVIGVLLTQLLAGLAAGVTLLFEVSTASSLGGFLIFISDTGNLDTAGDGIIVSVDGAISDFIALGLYIGTPVSGSGVHKIAITLNRDIGGGDYEYAWSNDGDAAETQSVSYAAPIMSDVTIGHDGAGNGNTLFQTYIRSITIYPAMDPADLPALTA